MNEQLIKAHSGWASGAWDGLTDEEAAQLRSLGINDLAATAEERAKQYHVEFIGLMSELAKVQEAKPEVRWELGRVRGLQYEGSFDTYNFSGGKIAGSPLGPQINQISVAGQALHDIRTVTWMEDACTEELQRALDEGWKIIAVCPPNDSRRPTYIIGHIEVGRKF